MKKALFAASLALLVPMHAHAEDINAIFKRVNDFVAAKNYSKALEELGWARKEIEKMNVTQIQTFFPDTVAGFTGAKFETNTALGLTNLEREYTKSENGPRIKLSLSGGSGGGDTGLGGLAAFGRMAAMMGAGQAGQDTFRIAGRTATLQGADEGNPQLTIFLDSGSILNLEGSDGAAGDNLKSFAEALKLNDLDNYLRGQN